MDNDWYDVSVVKVSKYRIRADGVSDAINLVYDCSLGELVEEYVDDVLAEYSPRQIDD